MTLLRTTIVLSWLAWLASTTWASCASARGPTVKTTNGSYEGARLSNWDQDVFLGMPFAQPPTGAFRFQRPHFINTSWDGVRPAKNYTPACPQYSPPNVFAGDVSEDCLSVNVVRPAAMAADAGLPVLVWIHGGGFDGGGSSDPRYNLSGIVRLSQDMGRPIVGVSFNYRLNKLGFLQSQQLIYEGSANAGFHDQRLALMWIHENIAAFGGDPDRVTIWGESAGAQSVGLHLHVYDGLDEGLYQAAIIESGGPAGTPLDPLSFYDGYYEVLTIRMGCDGASDTLACLRAVPFARWQNTTTDSLVWNPIVDGDLWTDFPSVLAATGRFNPVPVLLGTNSDEGCSFATKGLDNETALWQSMLSYRNYALRPATAWRLLELYPDDPAAEPPYYLNPSTVRYPNRGLMWRRAAAIEGDMVMVAGRRRVAEQWTARGAPAFSYRFDTVAHGSDPAYGVGHFQNVAYSFQNISGNLGPLPAWASSRTLARDIGRAYVSFVYDYDPNTSRGNGSMLPEWPRYDLARPMNMVLNASGSWVEEDTYRRAGVAFLNEVATDLQIFS